MPPASSKAVQYVVRPVRRTGFGLCSHLWRDGAFAQSIAFFELDICQHPPSKLGVQRDLLE